MAPQALTDPAARDNAAQVFLSKLPTPQREQILRLQAAMAPIACQCPEPEHIFHPGWYERRLLIPAGMLVVGKTHRHAHPVGVIRGHALIISEFGSTEVRGGYFSASEPGVKRIVFTFEDTLFVTLHRNESDTHDLARIEAEHIVPDAHELPRHAREVLQ